MTKYLLVFIMAGTMLAGYSQETGSIDDKTLSEIKTSILIDDETQALMNAITNNSIKKLAVNRDNEGKLNHYFSNKIDVKDITDQKSSGRCWLFTGLNVMRPAIMDQYNIKQFRFSHNYSFFWDQFEKANLFLEAIIATSSKPLDDRTVDWLLKHPIGDGGQWTGVVNIVGKYGVVPVSAMPESENSENTAMMSRLLRRLLREDALTLRELSKRDINNQYLQKQKIKMLTDVYKVLVLCLGEPPDEFVWQYEDKDGNISEPRTYTPKSFYEDVVGINLGDYVMFMNDPVRPYYELYEIEYDRHMHEGGNWKYINLPMDEIKAFAKTSILADQPMYFSCDVGKQLDSETGTLDLNNYDYDKLLGVSFGMNKEQRIKTYDSGSSHGMSLVGVNILENGSIDKWLLENSWGAKKGHKGFLTMTDEWFSEYMFRLVIHKDYVDAKTLKILEKEPVMLPPWDPMFAPEE
ncbi:MAG: C1 family peptidase [Bacteroidota bacterium]|nr:C1 family peptidase [Bacteroidota bacterium]